MFKSYDYIAKNKDKWFLQQEERSGFQFRLMKQCVYPCIRNNETTVISNEENECFTNCMGKGLAVGEIFHLMNADTELKNYGGFKR